MKGTLTRIICFILLTAIGVTGFPQQESGPVAQQGVLDLRRLNLSGNSISLDGQWGFFWKQIVFPENLGKAGNPQYVPCPMLWTNLLVNGQKIPAQGYATYTLTILLPSKRPRIGLEVPDVYCAYKLYVNGVMQTQNGKPAASADKATPFWTTRTIALPPGERDTLVLVMQVANFWHAKGGTYKHMLIGDKDTLFLKKNRDNAYDLVLAGCMFMGALFFLGLFVFGRHDKTTLYFSFFCILYSYRMIGANSYILHSLLPQLNWFLTIRVEYITLALCAAFFTKYTKHLYPDDANPRIMGAMWWFCIIYAALCILTSPLIFTRYINLFLLVMFLCTAYALFVFFQAARNKRSGSLYALLSTAVMLVILFLINLEYFAIITALKAVIFTGYIAFFFLQSLALSHRFAHSLNQAALQAQQGLKAKSEFLSTMSHEIRTPLNAVIGMTHLLLRHDPRADQKEDLGVLLFSANNLLSIVNNILDYNKIEEGKIGFEQIPMDLPAIAGNIVAGLKSTAQEKGIDLLIDIDIRLDKKLIGDPTRTGQVINNLVHKPLNLPVKVLYGCP